MCKDSLDWVTDASLILTLQYDDHVNMNRNLHLGLGLDILHNSSGIILSLLKNKLRMLVLLLLLKKRKKTLRFKFIQDYIVISEQLNFPFPL